MRIKKYLAVIFLVFGVLSVRDNSAVSIAEALAATAKTIAGAGAAVASIAATPAGSTALMTEDYNTYGFQPFASPSQTLILKFDAKATNDIHVALKYGTNNYLEIPIGGWGNTKSVMRIFENGSQKGDDIQVSGPAQPIPDMTNFVTYVFAIANGTMTVMSQTSSGLVATVFTLTNDALKKDFTAYSFRRWSTWTWYVKNISVSFDNIQSSNPAVYGFKACSSSCNSFMLVFSAKARTDMYVDLQYNVQANSYIRVMIGAQANTGTGVLNFANGRDPGMGTVVWGNVKQPPISDGYPGAGSDVTYILIVSGGVMKVFSKKAGGTNVEVVASVTHDLFKQPVTAYSFSGLFSNPWTLTSVVYSQIPQSYSFSGTEDLDIFLTDKNFSELTAFVGLTTRLAKLQKIGDLLLSAVQDSNAVAAYSVRAKYCNALLGRVLPQSTDFSTLTADEKNALQNIIVQAYFVCSKLGASASLKLNTSDNLFFDLKKGVVEDTQNNFKALGFAKNSDWAWQIETINLLLRTIAFNAPIPATAADTVSAVGVFLARALMAQAPASIGLTQQELNDYWKPGVTATPALTAKYLAAYYAGYVASSNATKDAVRDLTGCLIKIRGLISGVDSNNYPSLAKYDGVMSYVASEAEITAASGSSFFSVNDIPVVGGQMQPVACVLRVNGRYLQYTGTDMVPAWGVASDVATATKFKVSVNPAGTLWSTGAIDATLPISLVMTVTAGDVPLRCVSRAKAAELGLPVAECLLRPGSVGTSPDVLSLKLTSTRQWLPGKIPQPATTVNGVSTPKSSWLYRVDVGSDKSIFTALDSKSAQLFVFGVKDGAVPAGYDVVYLSFEPAPASNPIRLAFSSIPPLESFVRTAKIDFILNEMTKIARSENPSEIESFKFARSGETLSKFFYSLSDKQQAKLLSSVMM